METHCFRELQLQCGLLTAFVCILLYPSADAVTAQVKPPKAADTASSVKDVNARDADGNTALIATASWTQYDAVGAEEGEVKKAEQLLLHGVGVDIQNNKGMTALMYAAGWGHSNILQTLLTYGANVDLRDKMDRTALTWGAREGADSKIVRALRQHGAKVGLLEAVLLEDQPAVTKLLSGKVDKAILERRDGYEATALMAAAEEGNRTLVRTLLDKGADPNAHDAAGLTALMLTVAGRHLHSHPPGWYAGPVDKAEEAARLSILLALLSVGAKVNASDTAGETPLLRALWGNRPRAVELLLHSGADANLADKKGETPLMAAMEQQYASIPLLLAHGAKVDVQDQHGDTVLKQAILRDDREGVVFQLLQHGADVNLPNREGRTPLMAAAQSYNSDKAKVEMVKRLLQRGAKAFAQDHNGSTALTYAALWKCRPLIALLRAKGLKIGLTEAVYLHDPAAVRSRLAAGDNPNPKTYSGLTLLMIAAEDGDAGTVRELLTRWVDVNTPNIDGKSILHIAIGGNMSDYPDAARPLLDNPARTEIVRMLLDRGAKANAANEGDKVTALMLATALGNTDCVRLLLAHGADVTRRDKDGKTALMLAGKYKYRDIEALLKPAGAKE